MVATEILLSFVLVPVLAWAGGLFLRWRAYVELQRALASRGLPPPSPSRFALISAYGVAPALFGIILWFLSQPIARVLEARLVPTAVALEPLLLWAGIAYSAASVATVASQAILLRPWFARIFSGDMGRVITLYAIPFTAVVFALVMDIILFGSIDSLVAGGRPASAAAVDAVVRAFVAFSLATLAFPVAAAVSNRIRDLSGRGFLRMILVLEAGEVPIVLGLVMGLLAIGSL